MTYAGTFNHQYARYYQPTLLELAREGNFQAIAYWLNSLLAPQGIHTQVGMTRSGRLKIQLHFPRRGSKDGVYRLRDRLVRFICYRLWTLNSSSISDVWIVAQQNGTSEVLWQQGVRIATPANERLLRTLPRVPRRRQVARYRFQVMRSLILSSMATSGFFLGYWLFYLRVMGAEAIPQSPAAPKPTTAVVNQPNIEANQTEVQSLRRAIAPLILRPAAVKPPNQGHTVPQQYQGQVVREVVPAGHEKVVALTFDDGPWAGSTTQVLDVLKRYNIRATFFMTGMQVEKHPEIARRVVEEGHAVGNHSWNHPMTHLDPTTAAQEVNTTAQVIEQTTGVRPQLFRPPGGNLTNGLADYAKQRNQTVLMWSVDSEDYFVAAPLILDNVLQDVRPGGIVLLHDGGGDQSHTITALPQIITALKQQGYRFVTIPELLELGATSTAPSPI